MSKEAECISIKHLHLEETLEFLNLTGLLLKVTTKNLKLIHGTFISVWRSIRGGTLGEVEIKAKYSS